MAILIFFILHWYISLFFQSVFHHRYAAHNAFTMSKAWEKVFYIGCFLSQGSSYISANTYGIMHRLHHEHTDQEEDPHSPHFTRNAMHMMWVTRNNYLDIYTGKTPVADKYRKNLPSWVAFERLTHTFWMRALFVGIYIAIYALLATAWWQYLLLPLTITMGAFQGLCINWWAHRFGYENYKMDNTSKNILPVDLVFWGEAYHNNHHKNPGRQNNAVRWFELDPGYWSMRGLQKLGIIRMARSH
ncbi:MAG: acyl-CoA desaturase [Sphingobacteriales bacterium]|nr:MAG: acyl-CoA desaturase [Sphingobacteriales bacterium]